jgi:hypothetical protein
MIRRFKPSAVAGMALVGLVAGCGHRDANGPRRPVSGTVKLGGEPLKTGRIVFVPLEAGPAAQSEVAGGAYSIGRSEGPGPGPYRVEIYSIQPTGKKVRDPDSGRLVDETRDLIPPGYNVQSKVHVEVKADGENTFAIDVTPPGKGAK